MLLISGTPEQPRIGRPASASESAPQSVFAVSRQEQAVRRRFPIDENNPASVFTPVRPVPALTMPPMSGWSPS
jgi:hypothetical protein